MKTRFRHIFIGGGAVAVLAALLLAAIVLDNWLHPRDEETARQGD